jgi:excisionase family DNA binding protein
MTDTARNIELLDPVSTDGLADLFDVQKQLETVGIPSETVGILNETIEIPCETPGTPAETVGSYSVAEAQKLLNLPRSTVYRYIHSGKYQTVKGIDGKLRILLRQSEIPIQSPETAEIPVETVEILGETIAERSEKNQVLPSGNVDVSELLRKLEAATYRLGYLEAQLEGKDREIRLLTDSQQQVKATWWQRFKQMWQKQ